VDFTRAAKIKETTVASNPSPGTSALTGTFRLGAITLASVVLASCGGGGGDKTSFDVGTPIQIRTLSNRADLVSDGNVLTEIDVTPGLAKQNMKVTLNGADITSAFALSGTDRFVGLVTGLQQGENTLLVDIDPGKSSSGLPPAKLVITNHPRSGPVYSGPAHLQPFYCATPTAVAQTASNPGSNASGLSGQPDANCNIPSETWTYYRTTTPSTGTGACSTAMPNPTPTATSCWQTYTPGSTPANMATTTTDSGQTVPFIVRVERGTMNRGIYDLAVLYDPSKPWTGATPQAQWNAKVYYHFGASTGQPRRQSRTTSSAWSTLEEQLKRGWLVVSNSMTDSVRNSNRVLMSETVMMMKEHIGDNYGKIKYTLGTGCSGGSINSNMNLSIFPGLLDGIVTSCTYPDSETTTLEVSDCVLLVEAYQKPAMTSVWTGLGLDQAAINARKAAINGHIDQTACHSWYNSFGSNGRAGVYFQRFVSSNATGAVSQSTTATNNCELPNSQVYDPTRPTETANLPRCNAWAWAQNVFGTIPGTNTARDTRDNVGVQYGLRALLNGSITPEEFVTLNEIVGGTNKDTEFQAQRSQADAEALSVAYRAGIVASGKNLAKAPIIDLRGWDDSSINVPPGRTPNANGTSAIHHQWFSWAVRDRIVREAGDANNQALWRFARTGLGAPGTVGLEAFVAMDQWLASLVTDNTGRSIEQKVRATRPADTRDFCLKPEDTTQTNRIYDMAVCDADPWLKPSLSPRQVAGGPRSEDVLKCQLKPLNQADYTGVSFTAGQWSRLQTLFATGVCDWSKPGVQQQEAQSEWMSPLNFKAAPGQGVPMGPPPTSTRS
jgi:hypothetical protein